MRRFRNYHGAAARRPEFAFYEADEVNFLARPGTWGVVSPGAQLFPGFWSLVTRVCLHPEEVDRDPELQQGNLEPEPAAAKAFPGLPLASCGPAERRLNGPGHLQQRRPRPGNAPGFAGGAGGAAGFARFTGSLTVKRRAGGILIAALVDVAAIMPTWAAGVGWRPPGAAAVLGRRSGSGRASGLLCLPWEGPGLLSLPPWTASAPASPGSSFKWCWSNLAGSIPEPDTPSYAYLPRGGAPGVARFPGAPSLGLVPVSPGFP